MGARLPDVGDDELIALHRPGRALRKSPAEDDRGGRAGWGDLHDAEALVRLKVRVDGKAQLVPVELLGAVDVAHRYDEHFQLPVHDLLLRLLSWVPGCAAPGGFQVLVMCSGRIGTRRSGLPTAARTAAATAGPQGVGGGSPPPPPPQGGGGAADSSTLPSLGGTLGEGGNT